MTIDQKVVNLKVIGKRTDKTLILRRPRYFLALQNVDSNFPTEWQNQEKQVSFGDYCAFKVGDVTRTILYSTDGQRWFYSPGNAVLFGGNK